MWVSEFRPARYWPGALLLAFMVFAVRTGDGWLPRGDVLVSVSDAATSDVPTTQPAPSPIASRRHPHSDFAIPPFESDGVPDPLPPSWALVWMQQQNAAEKPIVAPITPTSVEPDAVKESSYALDGTVLGPVQPTGLSSVPPPGGIGIGVAPVPPAPAITPAPVSGADPPPVGVLATIPEPGTAHILAAMLIFALVRRRSAGNSARLSPTARLP
jgi:hypothetical protein